MALADFIRRREQVVVGGQTYEVGPPTCTTVAALLALFRPELAAARRVYLDRPEAFDGRATESLLELCTGEEERAREVLRTCVRPDPVGADACMATARRVLSLCDLARIVETINLDALLPGGDGEDQDPEVSPSDEETLICLVAQQHGTSPMDVMDWPYEAMLTASEVIHAQSQARAGSAPANTVDAHASPAALASLGIQVQRERP